MQKNDLQPYRMFGLPLLVFMGVLAVVGIAATVLLNYLL